MSRNRVSHIRDVTLRWLGPLSRGWQRLTLLHGMLTCHFPVSGLSSSYSSSVLKKLARQ